MYKIAICDDDIRMCEQIEKILVGSDLKNMISVEIFYTCEKLHRTLLDGEPFDLIFLDIEFKSMDGVSMGNIIRGELKNDYVQIVYVSSRETYAMSLFDSRPMNFLIKPVTEDKIIACVRKGMELSQGLQKVFQFKDGKELCRVAVSSILYFESDNRKIIVDCGDERYEFYGKLDEIEESVGRNFIRIHKSYLVNETKVIQWQPNCVHLSGGQKLPVSRNYRAAIFEHADVIFPRKREL